MNTQTFHRATAVAVAVVAMCAAGKSFAQPSDIDIYGGNPNPSNRPNVLLVLDSSANWSSSIPAPNCYYNDAAGIPTAVGPSSSEQGKKIGIEKCALHNVINALPVAADGSGLYNVGLMVFNESPAANSGGYPRIAIQELSTANKAAILAKIKGLDILADKGNNAAFAKTMHEAYLYFKGSLPYQGTKTAKYDPAAFGSDNRYQSPSANACGRNYVIFIANGGPGEVTNNEAQDLLSGAGGSTALIDYPNSVVKNADEANWADEYARFMRGVDASGKDGLQGIITHGVAVTGASSDGLYPNFIRSMANYGGGSYYEASNANVLVQSLLEIFNEIQSVNSVFASASLPVSVTTRGTYLNQVYIGMFRPDPSGKPRWPGNLKQYKLKVDSLGELSMADRNNVDALSSTTGFLKPSAQSFWTEDSSFWINQVPLLGDPPSASDSPDGAVVEKGAAGQRLRTTYVTSRDARKVYTCIGCAAGTLGGADTTFNTANTALTALKLGVPDAERSALVNWLRGDDNLTGDELGPGGTTTVRPSTHGDVLHSRPAVINYGGATGVVVFYGANDGQLRALNGNQTGTGAGQELWSFIPEEVLPALDRLRDNAPKIRLSTTPAAMTANTPRDYFVDGPIGVYQKLGSTGIPTEVILYVGLRRGGRAVYAIDVTTPSAPRYLWKVTPATSGMSALGFSWSEARTAKIKGHANPVVVMGGGYDPTAEDATSPGTTTMGNAVYVLDAITGSLLHTFSTTRSVAADVALMDHDRDGFVDRAYAADLGGNIYRLNFEDSTGASAVSGWSSYRVADLGDGAADARKFFNKPDIVKTKNFTAIMLGSGDREKPLLSATQDHFFQVFDRRNAKGSPAEALTPIVFSGLNEISGTPSYSGAGCYMTLAQGEKVVNAATSLAGQTYFGTNRPAAPSANSCSANLGEARTYAMTQFCGAAVSSEIVGGGLPPSPVAGFVTLVGADGKEVTLPVVIGAPNKDGSPIAGPLAPKRPNYAGSFPLQRRYWYRENSR
jgi:type IV pilus assembly protein PilY1